MSFYLFNFFYRHLEKSLKDHKAEDVKYDDLLKYVLAHLKLIFNGITCKV